MIPKASTFLAVLLFVSNLLTVATVHATESVCAQVLAIPLSQRMTWGADFDFELAEATLRSQKTFTKMIPMHEFLVSQGKSKSGTSEVYYVEFETGLKGVWKPDADIWGPHAEEGTYMVAQHLGARSFVPTIVTEIGGRPGTLSAYVHTPHDLVAMNMASRTKILAQVPKKQLADMDLIHYLMGQWDRHYGNFLVDAHMNLIVIDNEVVSNMSVWKMGTYPFNRTGRLPMVESTGLDAKNGASFPYDRVQYLNGDDAAAVAAFAARYGAKASNLETKKFDRYPNRQMPYVIWRDIVWRGNQSKWMPPIDLTVISKETLENLKNLTENDLRSLLNPQVFQPMHLELLLQRRADILARAASAEIIP